MRGQVAATQTMAPGRGGWADVFRLLLAGSVLLVAATVGRAHALNWTRLTLVPNVRAAPLEARLEVDLALLVGGYDRYLHAVAQDEPSLVAAAEQAMRLIHVRAADGADLSWTVAELVPPPPEPGEFFAAQPAPMSYVRLAAPWAGGAWAVNVAIATAPQLELPVVVSVRDAVGQEPRLLGAGQSTVIELAAPATATRQRPPERQPSVAAAWMYFQAGFAHILPKGADHSLFLLVLFFSPASWRRLLVLMTCFTIAHTLALAAATMGWVELSARVVEPTIAISITIAGVGNLRPVASQAALGASIFGFGLVHGLGFARGLIELGVPAGRMPLALGAFNAGVEVGQLCVLLAAFACLGWWRSRTSYPAYVAKPASMVIAAIALGWTIRRLAM